MPKLMGALDSRIKGPKPTSSPPRTAPSLLDVVHASSANSDRPTESVSCDASSSASEPSSPNEPIPNNTTTSTELAATARSATTPPSSCPSSACPPSPPCAAAAQPSGSHRRHATSATNAAADRPSVRSTWLPNTHDSPGGTSICSRWCCACACTGRRCTGAASRPSTTWIWRHASTKW